MEIKTNNTSNKNIHFFLNSKGGVGTTYVASYFYQYLIENNISVTGIDTFVCYKGLSNNKNFNVIELNIFKDGEIDQYKFDEIIETAVALTNNSHLIVDCDSASTNSLIFYLINDGALEVLEDNNINIFLHTILTKNNISLNTSEDLEQLINNFPNDSIIIWKNYYFGKFIFENENNNFHLIVDTPININIYEEQTLNQLKKINY